MFAGANMYESIIALFLERVNFPQEEFIFWWYDRGVTNNLYIYMEHKSKQLLISIIAVVILVLLAIFLFARKPADDGTLSDEERQAILNALSADTNEPLSDEERQAILEALAN